MINGASMFRLAAWSFFAPKDWAAAGAEGQALLSLTRGIDGADLAEGERLIDVCRVYAQHDQRDQRPHPHRRDSLSGLVQDCCGHRFENRRLLQV